MNNRIINHTNLYDKIMYDNHKNFSIVSDEKERQKYLTLYRTVKEPENITNT